MLLGVDDIGFLSFKYCKMFYFLNYEKIKEFLGENFLIRINDRVWYKGG